MWRALLTVVLLGLAQKVDVLLPALCFRGLAVAPSEEELDQDHDGQGQEYDEAGEDHEGSWESLKAGVVDESVERVGEEVDEAGDEGERGEDPAHLPRLHGLA